MKKLILTILDKIGLLTFVQILNVLYVNNVKKIRAAKVQVKWRSLNRHNHTFAANTVNEMEFPLDKVTVGKQCYGPLSVHHFGTADEKLIIGNYCSISNGVKFILGGNHSISTFSTFPFRHFFNNYECEAWTKGPIIVKDDVWIGTDAIILSGITLGKGTVIAAGSIVTKSSLQYSLIGGNPAKLIKMRFDDTIIKALLDIDFEKIDEERILALLPKLYMPLNEKLLSEIKIELLK